MAAALSATSAMAVGGRWVGRQRGNTTSTSSGMSNGAAVVRRSRGGKVVVSAATGVRTGAIAVAAGGVQIKNKRGRSAGAAGAGAGAGAGGERFGAGLAGMGMGCGEPATMRGAFHAAALACSRSSPTRRAGVVTKAEAAGGDPAVDKPKFENVGVFNVSTEKLPGGDRLTNEGILGFALAAFLAFWFGTTAIRTFAVMIGFVFTTAKYFAMGIALLLIGVAVS